MFDILINGEPLDTFGGCALLDYSIGATGLTNTTFQGVDRTSWRLLKSIVGQREIKLTLVFTGTDLHMAKLQRSAFNGKVYGKSELYIADDGFFYDVACTDFGEEVLIGQGAREAKIKAEYTFTGIRRGPLVSETIPGGGSVLCMSTTPWTDCRLTVTVGSSASSYVLGGATFGAVSAGDVLVFDGIDGKITKNGSNAAATTSWTDFPSLTPGLNTIAAANNVTVEYYPVYI